LVVFIVQALHRHFPSRQGFRQAASLGPLARNGVRLAGAWPKKGAHLIRANIAKDLSGICLPEFGLLESTRASGIRMSRDFGVLSDQVTTS
jgi:hypothetical protein